MKIHSVCDKEFAQYGRVLAELDTKELISAMEKTPVPDDVIYVPSDKELESLNVYDVMSKVVYGDMPVQIGYCNGHNQKLNAVEYHRSSEINVAATDMILLLGKQQDIKEDYTYNTADIEAFLVPAGMAVEVYATTLHYAPCGPDNKGFQVAVVLPKGTNYELTTQHAECPVCGGEDALITATNKWLIGHEEGGLPKGSFIGLKGKNLNVAE